VLTLVFWQDVPRASLDFVSGFVIGYPPVIWLERDPKILVVTLILESAVFMLPAIELVDQVIAQAAKLEVVIHKTSSHLGDDAGQWQKPYHLV
jgi:hypothetical protein